LFEAPDSAQEFINACEGMPFMSEKKLVVVYDFHEKSESEKRLLKEYLSKPNERVCLVFCVLSLSEIYKTISLLCELVDCGRLERNFIINNFVINKFKKEGRGITYAAAEQLCRFCNNDLMRIRAESEKLISYSGLEREITVQDIDLLIYKDLELMAFELTNEIGRRNAANTLLYLKTLLEKGESCLFLLITVYNYFRRLLYIKISGLKDTELSKLFGVKEYAVLKQREQAALFSESELRKCVEIISAADFAIKSGNMNDKVALQYAILNILHSKEIKNKN
jgi:DNA polymerase-3 subunit delta